MTLKRTKIVILPTTNKSNIILSGFNTLFKTPPMSVKTSDTYQHLYILSDEEIKEGDWCINKNGVLFKQETDKIFPLFNGSKKVIATTDPKLHKDGIAKIPITFIEEYITEYNKGNIIELVNVEYQRYWEYNDINFSHKTLSEPADGEILKLHKDNTIIIHKIKDSWNREEYIEGMWQAYKKANTIFEDEVALKNEFNKWIEKIL